jgi:hypothetical protein
VIENLKGRAVTIAPETRLALGSSEDYGLYYCTGNLDAQHLSGYGILMIDGNARLGEVDWHGLILAKGTVSSMGAGQRRYSEGF